MANRFGGVERVEDAGQHLFGNAAAVVLNLDLYHVAFRRNAGAQGDDVGRVALGHGLRGVGDQVQENLVDLRGRARDVWHLAVVLANLDVVLEQVARQQQRAVEARLDREVGDALAVQTAEVLQVEHNLRDLLDAVHAIVEQAVHLAQHMLVSDVAGQLLQPLEMLVEQFLVALGGTHGQRKGFAVLAQLVQRHQLVAHDAEGAFYIGQRRVDLVGNAGHHLAECGHFFGLHQLYLRFLELLVAALQRGVGLGQRVVGVVEQLVVAEQLPAHKGQQQQEQRGVDGQRALVPLQPFQQLVVLLRVGVREVVNGFGCGHVAQGFEQLRTAVLLAQHGVDVGHKGLGQLTQIIGLGQILQSVGVFAHPIAQRGIGCLAVAHGVSEQVVEQLFGMLLVVGRQRALAQRLR